MTRLLTLGTFDTPHMGHAAFLRQCERYADEVIVGVNSDAFVTRYKGKPIFTFEERAALIRALGYIVAANDGPGRALIEALEPDVLAVGSDWATRDYHAQIDTPQSYLDDHRIWLVFLPYTPGISTSILLGRLSL